MDYSISISFSAYNFHASNGLPRQGTKHREATMAHDDASRWGPGPWFRPKSSCGKITRWLVGWLGKDVYGFMGQILVIFVWCMPKIWEIQFFTPKKVIMSGVRQRWRCLQIQNPYWKHRTYSLTPIMFEPLAECPPHCKGSGRQVAWPGPHQVAESGDGILIIEIDRIMDFV